MKKLAEVLQSNADGTAKIVLYKHQKCSGCGLCNRDVHPGSEILAENPVNAGKGDMVLVDVHKKFSLKPLVIQYLLPLVAFFGGLGLGELIFRNDLEGWKSMILAFTLLLVAIVFAFLFQKAHRPIYTAKISKRA